MGDCWLQPLPLYSLSQPHPDRGSHPHSVSQPQAKTDPVTSLALHLCTKLLRWPGRSQPVPPLAMACVLH